MTIPKPIAAVPPTVNSRTNVPINHSLIDKRVALDRELNKLAESRRAAAEQLAMEKQRAERQAQQDAAYLEQKRQQHTAELAAMEAQQRKDFKQMTRRLEREKNRQHRHARAHSESTNVIVIAPGGHFHPEKSVHPQDMGQRRKKQGLQQQNEVYIPPIHGRYPD